MSMQGEVATGSAPAFSAPLGLIEQTRMIRNVVPCPGRLSTWSLPPWPPPNPHDRQPRPRPAPLVEKPMSKIRPRFSAEIPGPFRRSR